MPALEVGGKFPPRGTTAQTWWQRSASHPGQSYFLLGCICYSSKSAVQEATTKQWSLKESIALCRTAMVREGTLVVALSRFGSMAYVDHDEYPNA